MKKTQKTLMFMSLVVVVVGVSLGFFAYSEAGKPVDLSSNENIYVRIPAGYGTTQIASLLKQNGLIRNTTLVKLMARINNLDGKLQEGEYYFRKSMSTNQILDKIAKGEVIRYSFTIPEGYTVKQIAALLARLGYVNEDKFLELARNGDYNVGFEYKLAKVKEPLEGFLFPDTYSYAKGMSEDSIIKMMIANFSKNMTQEIINKGAELGMDPHKIVTVSSLIEREAKLANERYLVSSVIHNRLRISMRLQLCATVMYILPVPKTTLLNSDLEIDSPYNTYKYSGLPPGPISSPGAASLQAAVNPENTDYLYFVAKNDGGHIFSRTFAEHQKAIDEIRRGK